MLKNVKNFLPELLWLLQAYRLFPVRFGLLPNGNGAGENIFMFRAIGQSRQEITRDGLPVIGKKQEGVLFGCQVVGCS